MVSYYPIDSNQNNINVYNNKTLNSEKDYENFKDEIMDSLIIKMKEIEMDKENKKNYIIYPFL